MDSQSLRQTFLDFFVDKGHHLCSSASLIPHQDPSLLFTTAGMVPFKNIFTGQQKTEWSRAVSAQKCLRAGGKHNDLEQVGYTSRHHTFFEMLGNFSFGDYFKAEAIEYAWTFLTKILKIDAEKLWVTVYHTDQEAADLWKKIANLSSERILPIASLDNFWSAGETGPCGPCTEIFYDHGAHIPGGLPGTPEEDGDRFVELWNLVFMQFDQTPEGRIPLPSPSIDTGMGLERLAAVMQGVTDNFDTDILKSLVHQSKALVHHTQIKAGDKRETSHRVIADHLRSASFLIADGVLPGAEGRNYVLRRILRRALRHTHYIEGATTHLAALVPSLIEKMSQAYPELISAQSLITTTLTQEADRFKDLLARGLDVLAEYIKNAPPEKNALVFPGELAFKLYDTFGFPLDLTQDILKEHQILVDEQGFHLLMAKQKSQSKTSWSGSGESAESNLWYTLSDKLGATLFYDERELTQPLESQVVGLVVGENPVEVLEEGQEGYILLDKTLFYGESGGQMGEGGRLFSLPGSSSVEVDIVNTFKKQGLHIHQGTVKQGTLRLGQNLQSSLCVHQRNQVRAHHSATHLLQAALRDILGQHVVQKGSWVTEKSLRFDFSHISALTEQEIFSIEERVNDWCRACLPVGCHLMPYGDALKTGALALFGEKYDDQVRVIAMGEASKELCGGTHVNNTGEIGCFKILTETSVSSGIRRIEAVAGEACLRFLQQLHQGVKDLGHFLKVGTRMEALQEKVKKDSLKLKALEKQMAQGCQENLSPSLCLKEEKKEGARFSFWHAFVTTEPKELKGLMDMAKRTVKEKNEGGIILLACTQEERTSVVIGRVGQAAPLATEVLKYALGEQGSGGGREDLAQGGGALAYEEMVQRCKTFFA